MGASLLPHKINFVLVDFSVALNGETNEEVEERLEHIGGHNGREKDEGEQAENRVSMHGGTRTGERSENARCETESSSGLSVYRFHKAE